MEGGSGPRGGVHNKQMFILSGFIISDPDCNYYRNLIIDLDHIEDKDHVKYKLN